MKKVVCLLLISMLLACAKEEVVPTPIPTSTSTSTIQTEGLETYRSYHEVSDLFDNYTVGIQLSYDMHFEDNTYQTYLMDGVLEAEDTNTNPIAHASQNINTNGIHSVLDSYYMNHRLYSDYNNVTYYEDMSFEDLKKTFLIPFQLIMFEENQIESYINN